MKYRKEAVSSVRFFGRVWNRPPFLESSFAVLTLLDYRSRRLPCSVMRVPFRPVCLTASPFSSSSSKSLRRRYSLTGAPRSSERDWRRKLLPVGEPASWAFRIRMRSCFSSSDRRLLSNDASDNREGSFHGSSSARSIRRHCEASMTFPGQFVGKENTPDALRNVAGR